MLNQVQADRETQMRLATLLAALLLSAPAFTAPRPILASDLMIRQSNAQISWRWRAAPELATQPSLLRALRSEAQREAARATRGAIADAASAKKAGFPFRPYEYITDWSLAADTPRLLALAAESYSYTGGAHGNTGYAVRIWDKTAKRSIPFSALFSDWPRARKLLEPPYCKVLAEEQRRRTGAQPLNEMNACPKLSEQPILPFAGLARSAMQFRVLLGPYVAGSYAEGSYKIDATWPESVKALVKPAYRRDLAEMDN